MDNMYDWNTLSTLAGASALAFLIVSYTKRWANTWWPKVLGTDLYVVLVSLIILIATTLVTNWPPTVAKIILALFNAFLVAATAGKMSDKSIKESHKDGELHE
ncbi:MAG: hypothetical protein K0S75_1447 [Clostridia bacterium]|nr:hypothetical protein [Clostridia bacterium]